MKPKYTIEYMFNSRNLAQVSHCSTDDPVACEELLEELLERGSRIKAIKHQGLELSQSNFDKMIKVAAGMLASKSICASLGIKPEEERYRFGFAAGNH